ncbi:MAG: GNAT family N-acetyltransferase [Bdellovibrionales bacterium]|nr:GNAT family N-acetyltransferase [Ramlibacter sp.]
MHDASAVIAAGTGQLDVRWADSEADVREAQHLRYQVFAREMGARLTPPKGTEFGLDVDRFDAFCDHLLVRAVLPGDDGDGPLVGTYRVLGPQAARRAGGLYSDSEFDLAPLALLRPQAVELGRSCVHPAWRSGGVIMALWSALCQYMLAHRLDTMIGCASIGLDDGGRMAGRLWRHLRHTHLAAPQWQVSPRTPLPLDDAIDLPPAVPGVKGMADAPPLIKGYLRCGARLLGPPALDAAFNTADLPVMLRIDELAPRYRKHFLGN